ncbi:MAG: hypothetical protein V8R57_01785 [Evtepia sp.]
MQENHSLAPATEHRAQACSTKDLGIKATSSSSTPASVMPWISAALPSSFSAKEVIGVLPPAAPVFNSPLLTFSSHRNPSSPSKGSTPGSRFRRMDSRVSPHSANCCP